jgi:hypothetical protein
MICRGKGVKIGSGAQDQAQSSSLKGLALYMRSFIKDGSLGNDLLGMAANIFWGNHLLSTLLTSEPLLGGMMACEKVSFRPQAIP